MAEEKKVGVAKIEDLRVLVVDDEDIALKTLVHILRKEGYKVKGAPDGEKARALICAEPFDIVLTDLVLGAVDGLEVLSEAKQADPDCEVIVITGYASVDAAVSATKKGAFHFLQKPVKPDLLRSIVSQAAQKRLLGKRVRELEQKVADQQTAIIGSSPKIAAIRKLVAQVAASDASVLICGESGTGKELAARALHDASDRATKPFVAVNCASFTEELLANELFGHEKEAFTGATRTRPGLLESAHEGTVFFDEIGDMPLSMQAKLLRAIQEKEILRVGGTQAVPVDVRVIAATNKDLKELCELNRFRLDLYYRLNVITMRMPTLAERKEDIPLLAGFFLGRFAAKAGKKITGFSDDVMEILAGYDFPGNVRELMNIVEHACSLCRTDLIRVEDLPPDLTGMKPFTFRREDGRIKTMEHMEREYIQWVLKQTSYNKTRAAEALGIDRVSLYRKIRRFELKD
ncbi:MAG: sigma-54 dependent transcriptional regulator [Thermodesulfobacteriota bacterium]